MNKKIILPILIIIAIISFFFILNDSSQDEMINLMAKAKKGRFVVEVLTTGELEAKNSVKIYGPENLRAARIWEIKIEDIVPEGTIVKKGDYIASIDRSEISEKIRNEELDLEQSETNFTQTKLDTAFENRKARDDLAKAKLDFRKKEVALKKSKYEPPATIEQAELELEEARMNKEQAELYYNLQRAKSKTQMQKALANLVDDQNDMKFLQSVADQFTVYAPQKGMVIYTRNRRGTPQGKGASVSTRDPVIATLPDLSKMISRTYVNEVDIRRISPGQPVEIGLDAFPEKEFSGKIISVANVGEQRPNSNAKVFEVTVELNESDTTLRPAMTTSNRILTQIINDVVSVPLEAINSLGDSVTFVYMRQGINITRQQVLTGLANANEVIILDGLAEGDQVFLSTPDNPEEKKLVMLEETPVEISHQYD